MKIKIILTDVGGVLVRTESIRARKHWEQKLHMKSGQLTREISKIQPAKEATVGLVSAEEIWHNVAEKYSINRADLKQLRIDYFKGEKLNKEFYSFIQKLHKDFKVVLFTNAWDDGREVYTDKYQLDKICNQMIISAEEGMRKPHKKFYFRALELLHVKPQEVIYIDDRKENIKAGKEIGFNSILFSHTKDVIDQIKTLI
ncbi:MAG TPA: HAD family phosphatase [Xanthomonadales bacterium]|nr:HAD family phosphatase [Xanthomonadales bacterium]